MENDSWRVEEFAVELSVKLQMRTTKSHEEQSCAQKREKTVKSENYRLHGESKDASTRHSPSGVSRTQSPSRSS